MKSNNILDYLGQGLMGFAQNLVQGQQNAQKLELERQQIDAMNAYRQAQLEQMAFNQQRQQKSDWQNDYDKGMKQIANNYLAGILTGQSPSLPDPSVLGYMDPSVLAAIQQKDQDRAMTGAFMKAVGGALPGSPPTPNYSGGTAYPKPTSSLPGNLDFSGAATAVGAPELASFLPSVVKAESGGNPNAQATTSSAYGLGQFTSGTRQAILNKYGVDAWSKDPNEQVKALAYLARDNRDGLASSMGVTPDQITPQQIYIAHFLGQGGANTFLTGMQRDPNTPAVALVSPEAARANAGIFFKKDSTPRTAQEVFDLMGSKVAPVQPAEAGGQTVTDASSPPQAPGQSPSNKWADLASKAAPFVAAPGKVGDMAKNIVGVAKTMTDLTQPQNDIVEREDGTYMVDKRTGQYRKIEGIPGKDTGNFTDPNDKLIFKLAPGYGNGNSEEQDRQYEQAWYNKYGNPRTMPDGSIVRMTPPPNIPTPNGMQTGEVAGKKPLTASDAGKIQGANLSTAYLDDVEKKLFPGGKYDRTAMMKSYLPGTDEADIRNKIREAIGYALYLKTGAAATPKEIAEQETLYTPGLADSEMTARSKLDRLKAFLNSVVQGTGRDKANGATGSWDQQTPASPDLKAKYGLE